MEDGGCGVEGDGALDEGEGGFGVIGLGGEDAEEVEGVDVVGIDGEDLAVEGFGFGEAVGLVVGEGGGEEVLEIGRGHGYRITVRLTVFRAELRELGSEHFGGGVTEDVGVFCCRASRGCPNRF